MSAHTDSASLLKVIPLNITDYLVKPIQIEGVLQLSPDILPRIFDPYFTTKEEGKGTGIGLYMAKKIIENHMGGTLQVKNTKDGVAFSIVLQEDIKTSETLPLH